MQTNPLRRVSALGQSVWLDYLQRALIDSGELAALIRDDGVAGVTSNPAIFEKAIDGGSEYGAPRRELARRGLPPAAIYEALTLEDVGRAAELLRPLYERSAGEDGYVSIEVSPHLAYDADATVAEAQRLWAALGRPNVMIKVPGTRAGLPAIRRLLAAGINVNVTLLFSVARYREVAEAFVGGLEQQRDAGGALAGTASVASFFLSRIDTKVDQRLDAIGSAPARALRGQAALVCARLAYQAYKAWTATERWRALAVRGARPQRLLWASTGTKDPAYSDVKYVDALIGPQTVNTLTPETVCAYRDHGAPAVRIEDELDAARALPQHLAALGIDLEEVARQLEAEGVQKFIEPYDRLHAALAARAADSG